jgi:hypothetical protein
MLIVDTLPQSNLSEITPTIDGNSDSISPIDIPLTSSQPILAISPNYILVNEYTKKRNRLIFIDHKFQRSSIRSPITDLIIDALWYHIEEKFFLLTPRKIFSYDPEEKMIESMSDIKSDDSKPLKSFTIDNKQSSLLIAYDEWQPKFLHRWKQDQENGRWKLIKRHPLNLTSNEFIGILLAINDDNCSKIAMTIYNNFTEEWRMELRDAEILICLKKILLPGSDPIYDYRMITIEHIKSDIKWLIHSQANDKIIAIDSQWQQRYLNYKSPICRMAQFKMNNLIVRTRNRFQIRLLI